MEFPIYRKYKGLNVWFKITSDIHFFEYKKLGKKLIIEDVKATIFPEKQFIKDMIDCHEGRWEKVTKSDLEQFINV